MTDILDSLDELREDDDAFEALEDLEEVEDAAGEDEVYTGEVVLFTPEEDFEMDEEQAHEITDAIRSSATATYILLAQAHKHKAYKALGYETWSEYVRQEFDISTQRSYQLLDLSKAVAMIEEAVPEGTVVKLTEAQARDIKRELPRITEQLREETAGQSPERAAEIAEALIDDIREQKKADAKETAKKQKDFEEKEEQARLDDLEAQADALLEADRADSMTDQADDGLIEVELEGESGGGLSPEDSMHLYNFFNVLSGISSLPEPDDFISIVPENRVEDINNQLLDALSWLNRFQTLWELKD